jgi:hypothetical protein
LPFLVPLGYFTDRQSSDGAIDIRHAFPYNQNRQRCEATPE